MQSETKEFGFAPDGHIVDPLSREALIVMTVQYTNGYSRISFDEYPKTGGPIYLPEPVMHTVLAGVYESNQLPDSILPSVEHALLRYDKGFADETKRLVTEGEAWLRKQANERRVRANSAWSDPNRPIGASV
ncbi:MAG: hypothetical protein HY365_02500 [Candidatus Aenigmarchaeota archaeon]|nr:hypothetical protein [Candidatus Aenigmarchaeota archaeon]